MSELQKYEPNQIDTPLSVEQLVGQVNLIQKVMSAVMKDGEHFGIIPGCGKKPSLLQPGAQKLLVTFRLAPEYQITKNEMERGHREYVVQCTLKTIGSGSFVGQGAGSASTMEGKWRFRVAPKTLTDRPVPKAYWDLRQSDPKAAQEAIGGKGFSTQKNETGAWMIAEGSSDKVEHDNPSDYYNTVLKMACKRALVAATLTATAASDIFTQDVEELVENMRAATAEATPVPPVPKPTPTVHAAERPVKGSFESVVDGDEKREDLMFEDFKIVNSKPGAKSEWTAAFCKFSTDSGSEFEAGTFDAKVIDKLDVLKGKPVTIVHRAGRKAGTRELLSIEPLDQIP